MSTYGNDWIITFSNSEDTDVFFWRFFGTEEAVKEKLVTFAKEHSTVGRVRFCIHGSVGMDFSKISEYSCYIGVGNIFRSPYAERNTSGDWKEIISDEYEIAYILYAEPRKNPMSVPFLRDCVEACGSGGLGLTDEQLLELDRERLATPSSKQFRLDEALLKYKE